MGKATVYCETCGEVIPGDDFDKGRAVRYQEKDYCAKCKQEISHLLKPTEDADALARKTSRIRTIDPNSASGVRKSSAVRTQSGVRRTVQAPAVSATPARGTPNLGSGNGHRDHPSQLRTPVAPSQSAPSGEKKMYYIGGAAVLLVVIILAVASMSKKSEENTDTEKRAVREKVAKEAYENCLSYCTNAPHEYVGQLNLIAEARSVVAGTDWEVKLSVLQKQAEETKRTKEKRDETVGKIDELRARIGQEPKAANEIKGKLEALRSELPDDKDLQERISQYIEEARRAAFQSEFDEVKQYVQTNPMEYDAAIEKYGKLRSDMDAFTEDFQQQMLPLIDEASRFVKEARENDAASRWATVRGNAENARGRKDYFSAISEVKTFIDDDRYSNCKVIDDARNFLREIEQERQAYEREQQKPPEIHNPPPDPGPGPGPGPAAGTVTLFDGVNLPGSRLGASAEWKVEAGEIRVAHKVATLPADDKIELSDILEFPNHPCDGCVFEFDAKIQKGGIWFGVGVRREGSEFKYAAGAALNNPDVFKPDTWYHVKIDFDGRSCLLSIDGHGNESIALQSPGRGSPALAIYQGCEVHMKNITLTTK